MLNLWDINKSQTLQQLFGGNDLILKKDYRHVISEEELLNYYYAIFEKNEIAADTLATIKERTFRFLQTKTINKNEKEIIEQLFTEKNIINNCYSGQLIIIYFTDGTSYKITPGTRLLRIIRHFVKKDKDEDYKNFLEQFNIWCSQVRNQNVIEGELCLSIHPLDYLTLSDNCSDWTSCISWLEPGESRAGTLECLNSAVLIVAYINNKKQPFEFADGYYWNNKQWRELFIFNKEIISEVKGYPYQNKNLTETVLNWLKELAQKNLNFNYPEKIDLSLGEFRYQQSIYHIIPERNYFMYNDFGSLKKHRGFINYLNFSNLDNEYFIDDNKITHYFTHIWYTDRATCAKCGKNLPTEEKYRNRVLCGKCEPGFKCAYCNSWIDNDKEYYTADFSKDEPICESCYNNFTFVDDLTDNIYTKDCMIKLYWKDKDGYLSRDNYIYIQDPGFYTEKDAYWEIFSDYPKLYWNNEYYITQDKIKDISKFMKLFGLDENPFI